MELAQALHMGLITSSNSIAHIVIGLLCVACGSLWWSLHRRRRRSSNGAAAADLTFPKGPPGWPVFGHLHIFKELPHQAFAKLSKEYGPMMGLRLGYTQAVVVSSPALAREVLLTHDQQLSNRPQFLFSSTLYYGGRTDLSFGENGPVWVKLRRLCVSEFLSPRRLQEQELAQERELDGLLRRIRDAGTAPIDIGRFVGDMVSNLLTSLLCSARFPGSSDNHKFRDLIKAIEEETVPTLGDFIPWLKFTDIKRRRRMKHLHDRFNKLLDSVLIRRKEAMKSMKPHEGPQDFLQALLSKEEEYSSSKESVTMREIKSLLMDMLLGGILTTTITVEWAMAELLKSRGCLERVRAEVEGVVGKGKKVRNGDVGKLAYLGNVVKEVLRLHPAAPLLVPRVSGNPCKLGGYVLPAATQVYVNTWAIMRDEQVWGAMATTFHPDRFHSSLLDIKGKHFELLPFGAGRRTCVGMPIGLSMVHVTIANLVSSFAWELPSSATPTPCLLSIDMSEKTGITNNKLHPVVAIPKPLLFTL